MTIRVKITTENTLSISNDKIEREIINLKEDELLELIKVCIANEKKFKVRRLHVLAGALALVLIATIATLIVVFTPSNYADNDYEDGGNGSLVMVGRQEWGEIAINESYHSLQHPTEYVLIAHTAGRLCQSLIECSYVVNYIQNKHIKERGFGDIAYNFLIGGDGRVYIGRDWDAQGRHTKPLNSKSIGIAFIGTFTTSLPPKRALRSAQLLLAKGVELGKLSENYTVYCQKQVIQTESPGLRLIQEIKRWPHWHTFDPQNDQPDYTSITPLHNI